MPLSDETFWPNLVQHVALEGLERARLAILVVAGDGRLIYANSAAEDVLQDGSALQVSHKRLASPNASISNRLVTLIQDASTAAGNGGSSAGGAIAIPRDHRLPLTLLIVPFHPARIGTEVQSPPAAAVIFVRDPETPTPAKLALQELFGLTPAEATIAAALAEGKSVEEIASAAGIGLSTVRTQIKRTFVKTSTNRQAQLVTVILRSIAALANQ
jgi:DNA-binding CsgD family transcriptional regulator